VSVVVSLVHDAQEIAILDGKEVLSIETLNEAYLKRMTLLHGYIEPDRKAVRSNLKKTSIIPQGASIGDNLEYSITDLVNKAKSENQDIVTVLKSHITVVEVEL